MSAKTKSVLSNQTKRVSTHRALLAGYLVAFLEMFHQNSHHHVHQHKLGHEHEGDKVQRRHQGQVGETVAVLWMTFP